MTDDTNIDRASFRCAYEQVADAIAARITSGVYSVKLPGERDLAKEFGVSYATARHAMAILRQRGLIVSVHGRGTYVARETRNGGSSTTQVQRTGSITVHP